MNDVVIGVDASNIRTGGGVTHLSELFRVGEPEESGITKVVVWGGQETLNRLPKRSWAEYRHQAHLDKSLPHRVGWQYYHLPQLVANECDLLFAPGSRARRQRTPVVTMFRNMLPFCPEERARYGLSAMRLKLIILRYLQARSFKAAESVIFNNYAVRAYIKRLLGSLRSSSPVIPHGVSNRFRIPPRPQRGLVNFSKEEPAEVLYVSRLEPYKHQEKVVQAVVSLNRGGLPTNLTLVGGGVPEQRRNLRRQIANKECIKYTGHVPNERLSHYYRKATAFVFASSCENMPNILIEAMAAGLPIAASQSFPIPSILGKAGFYFDPKDSDSIESELRKMLSDKVARKRAAEMAYQKAEKYSWKRCARSTFSHLAEVADRSQKIGS